MINVFEALPGLAALIKADKGQYTLLATSGEYAAAAGLAKGSVTNQPFFTSLPFTGNGSMGDLEKAMRQSFDDVVTQNEEHTLSSQQVYPFTSIPDYHLRYWNISNKPVKGTNGSEQYIIHTLKEVTEEVMLSQKQPQIKLMAQAHQLFMQAPVAIHILMGPDLVIAFANAPTLLLWGKGEELLGKKLTDVLPELAGQGYIEQLQQVRKTGETHSSYEASVTLVRNGREELAYLNFVQQPFYEPNSEKPDGVMVFCTDVTNEVNIRKELANKEQSLEIAIEIGELGIFTINLADNQAAYSAQIMNWFGLNESVGDYENIIEKIYPEDQPYVREAIDVSIAGKNQGRHDIIYRCASGESNDIRYLRSIGQVQFEGHHPKAISGTIQDVTQQVLLTKNLEESEERFRTMAEGTEILIAVADKSSNIVYFNNAWLQLTGLPIEHLLNFGWSELIHPDDRATFLGAYRDAFEQRVSFSGEFRILDRNGDYRWLLATVPVRFRPDGSFAGYVSSCIDITDRKMAEEALRKNEAQFRSVISAAPIAIGLFVGRDLVIEMANQTFFDIVGKGNQVIGKPLARVMPELVGQPFLQILDDVYTSGKRFETIGTQVNIVQNGVMKYGFYDFSYTPIFNEKGEVYAILDIAVDVTDQVGAKKALESNEQNLRGTILQAPVAMCIFKGPDFIVDVANHRMMEFWGKSSDLVLGKGIFEVLPEAREQGFEDLLRQVYTTGKSHTALEVKVNFIRNGETISTFVNFVYKAFQEPDGTINQIMAVAVDVTEQVEARKKVEASEQQVRSLVASAPFPIGVFIGREMRISLVNKSMIDTWGKGDQIIGKLYAEVLPELDDQKIYNQLDQVFTTGVPYHAKNQRVDLVIEGKMQIFYFNYSFTPLFDTNRQVYGVMNTGADVTDLNVAKQMVEASERDFRNLVMHAPVGICIVSGTPARVELMNDSYLEIIGKQRHSFNTNNFWEVLPEVADFYEPIMTMVADTGEPYTGREHKVQLERFGKVETVYVNFVFDPIKEADGTVKKIMILVIEVTPQVLARHKIEELVTQRTRELAAANKALQQNNEELGQFAYIASHDLQEPLRKVSTFTDMLKSSLGKLDAPSERYLQRISASTNRMSQLIQDVLNFSQLAKGKEIFKPVDLNQVLQNIIIDFELMIEQKGAQVIVGQLPTLDAVPLQMQQLFSNLLSNALKFSRHGVSPEVNIAANKLTEDDIALHPSLPAGIGYYAITVEDNGIGFNQEYAERIFQIFQRLHTKSDYSGTGIGLALCKKIIQNHHGEIVASSDKNNGATFTIILPEKQVMEQLAPEEEDI